MSIVVFGKKYPNINTVVTEYGIKLNDLNKNISQNNTIEDYILDIPPSKIGLNQVSNLVKQVTYNGQSFANVDQLAKKFGIDSAEIKAKVMHKEQMDYVVQALIKRKTKDKRYMNVDDRMELEKFMVQTLVKPTEPTIVEEVVVNSVAEPTIVEDKVETSKPMYIVGDYNYPSAKDITVDFLLNYRKFLTFKKDLDFDVNLTDIVFNFISEFGLDTSSAVTYDGTQYENILEIINKFDLQLNKVVATMQKNKTNFVDTITLLQKKPKKDRKGKVVQMDNVAENVVETIEENVVETVVETIETNNEVVNTTEPNVVADILKGSPSKEILAKQKELVNDSMSILVNGVYYISYKEVYTKLEIDRKDVLAISNKYNVEESTAILMYMVEFGKKEPSHTVELNGLHYSNEIVMVHSLGLDMSDVYKKCVESEISIKEVCINYLNTLL